MSYITSAGPQPFHSCLPIFFLLLSVILPLTNLLSMISILVFSDHQGCFVPFWDTSLHVSQADLKLLYSSYISLWSSGNHRHMSLYPANQWRPYVFEIPFFSSLSTQGSTPFMVNGFFTFLPIFWLIFLFGFHSIIYLSFVHQLPWNFTFVCDIIYIIWLILRLPYR